MYRLELRAGAEEKGVRLDVALAALPEVGSRAAAQRLIDSGGVTVDGRNRPKRHRLSEGERVVADPRVLAPASPAAGAGEGVQYSIVREDEHLIVVDKPAGVVVHPAPSRPTGTLSQALADRAAGGAEPWRPGVVHRLDRDTSGLLVVAKSDAVHRALQALIRERRMSREYLALVQGRVDARSGTVDAPLGRDRARRTLVSTRSDRPRAARTHFARLETLARTTLLRARLETGRTHQIRAHFAAIGHPVAGDAAYGGEAGRRLGLDRQFLHAARLSFAHPVTGQEVTAESQLPGDLAAALEAARAEGTPAEGAPG
jgi:23S rRNA pseudouridine1911/1915/1917 synthase